MPNAKRSKKQFEGKQFSGSFQMIFWGLFKRILKSSFQNYYFKRKFQHCASLNAKIVNMTLMMFRAVQICPKQIKNIARKFKYFKR